MFLRRAVGVTALSVEVPFLSPYHTLKPALEYIFETLQSLHNLGELTKQFLIYIMERSRMMVDIKNEFKERTQILLKPKNGKTPSLAADFNLHYLQRFFAMDLNIDTNTTDNESIKNKQIKKLQEIKAQGDQDLSNQKSGNIDSIILNGIRTVFKSLIDTDEKKIENSLFCQSWSSFIGDIKEHRKQRQDFYQKSLRAAGEIPTYRSNVYKEKEVDLAEELYNTLKASPEEKTLSNKKKKKVIEEQVDHIEL